MGTCNITHESEIVTITNFIGRTPAGSTDFTSDGARATLLVEGLTQFFGGGLGCTDSTIPPYKGREMNVVHANMGVTEEVFERFNEILIGVLLSKGVEKPDADTVGTVLVYILSFFLS
jgi:hypothetical protein